MNCKKCGKEIEDGSTLCENCGEATTPPKKKLRKKLIAIIAVVVAAVILVVSLASGDESSEKAEVACLGACGGNSDDVTVNGTDTSNEMIVKTGLDDNFGGVAFNLTIDEFIENYNHYISEDTSAGFAKHYFESEDDFEKSTIDSFTIYSKSFGYYSGSTYNELAYLSIYVNENTNKIQLLEYFWQIDGYNNDESGNNYYHVLPARLISIVDNSIEFPLNGNTDSYRAVLDEILSNDTGMILEEDYFYKYVGKDNVSGIILAAATKDSIFYEDYTNS